MREHVWRRALFTKTVQYDHDNPTAIYSCCVEAVGNFVSTINGQLFGRTILLDIETTFGTQTKRFNMKMVSSLN